MFSVNFCFPVTILYTTNCIGLNVFLPEAELSLFYLRFFDWVSVSQLLQATWFYSLKKFVDYGYDCFPIMQIDLIVRF